MIAEHLPVLVILLPLLGALTASFLRGRKAPWAVALVVAWAVFGSCLALLARVQSAGLIVYGLGGWDAPFGIVYRIDAFNAFFLVVVSGIAAIVTIPGALTSPAEVGGHRLGFFHSVYLLCLGGLLGIVITGDVFNMYVLLEVSSLATYGLVAMGRDRRARLAAFNYLVLGSIGATCILVGVGYLYALTGSLDIMDVAQRVRELGPRPALGAAAAFVLVGCALKSALFPLHSWLPDAYTQAPSAVAALLSGTATKVGLFMLLRFVYTIFGAELFLDLLHGRTVLLAFAAGAIVFGSIAALQQTDAARLLAYSSVAQGGYVVLGLALGTAAGLAGAILHVLNHAVTKGGLFLALGCVRDRIGSLELDEIRGVGRRMPWTGAALAAGAAGLVGMPLTAGFVSKWVLASAALEAGRWPLVAVIVAGALLAAAYAWRLLSVVYSTTPAGGRSVGEAPWPLIAPTWALVGASLLLGVLASVPLRLAFDAAESLR